MYTPCTPSVFCDLQAMPDETYFVRGEFWVAVDSRQHTRNAYDSESYCLHRCPTARDRWRPHPGWDRAFGKPYAGLAGKGLNSWRESTNRSIRLRIDVEPKQSSKISTRLSCNNPCLNDLPGACSKWRGFRATSTPSAFETAVARSVRLTFAIPMRASP